MTASDDVLLSHTTSRDGTTIGYVTSGEGPPLLLVHGGLGDHTRWDALRPHLEPHFTVHALDRRGRGASGDAPAYAVEREYEDVAAVVDAIAETAGRGVDVYGVSSGGFFAFGAARLTTNIRRLVLYEGWPLEDPDAILPSQEFADRLEALLADGEAEAALEAVFREYLQMSADDFDTLRSQPSWPARVASAHTVPREIRPGAIPELDAAKAAEVTVPTLLLVGEESPEHLRAGAEPVAAALPDARIAVLEGQAHAADLLAPELVAEQLRTFLGDPSAWPRG